MLSQTNQRDCERILTQRLKLWKLKGLDLLCVDLRDRKQVLLCTVSQTTLGTDHLISGGGEGYGFL